jgi:hypothetical protein
MEPTPDKCLFRAVTDKEKNQLKNRLLELCFADLSQALKKAKKF